MSRLRGDRRARARLASAAALLVATGAIAAYAVTADGYKSHRTDLNDGGIWVVNGNKGIHGRINKPINQLDGVIQEERGKVPLDVVQDGAAVVALNEGQGRGRLVDPRRLVFADGATAAVPSGGEVAMAGGTLATVDPASGKVWATRVDHQTGVATVSSVDQQAKPLATVGEQASMTVTQSGDVVAVSAEEGEVSWIEPGDGDFGEPRSEDLAEAAGTPDAITAVGDRVVTLDTAAGLLAVAGGAQAQVPEGSVLQQAGPTASTVLVGTPGELLAIDLDSGSSSVVAEAGGTPAAPVRLGACVFGAWSGGEGSFVQACGDADEVEPKPLGGDSDNLVFRVNRGQVVLNDAVSGAVWDVTLDTPVRIDNWSAFTAKKQTEEDDEKEQESNDVDRRPPLAKPDSYGVRAGRTTVLHPLDNDSAPEGRLLSIVEVSKPTGGARAQISPDGQTIVLTMPSDGRASTFDYFVDDGRANVTANATVRVDVRDEADNSQPAPRQGYQPRTYKVPAGGALSVPVLAEWRDDKDGDTLLLESARVDARSSASARTTSDGRIRFNAPTAEGAPAQTIPVTYRVTDGRSAPVERELEFEVQGAADQSSFAPVAEPDVLRGEVGAPIKVRPLLNDLPGADPATPNAELSLGGKVVSQRDLDVVTDMDAGTLVVTAAKPGSYFLDYQAAYGLAPLDRGIVRIDVLAKADRSPDPVAMPDTLTVFGQSPGLVDVLSNDLDPSGGLLVVQRAAATTTGQLDVAIVDGRWLRISARVPDLAPATQTVNYFISNGTRSGVRGEVVVTQRPEPEDNRPVTVVDRVVVRSGASVTAPVLDNDSSPSGDRLTLTGDVRGGVAGELDVIAPIDVTYEPGRAYLSGRTVRYVAPAGLKERDTFEVPYVAVNTAGDSAGGRLLVTVVPDGEKNTPPEPPQLEARSTSGQVVKVRVPGVGVDAEGDPVTVTGIVEAPALGRVVRFGGNFIEYQSYPRSVGTDSFSFAVADSRGAIGIGTARVAIVGSETSQPPLAVPDTLTVEPGRTATFDPLANDFVAPGDRATIALVDPPEGVRLDERTNLVSVEAPARLDDPAITVVYTLGNGLQESRSTMTLETMAEIDNPPVVYDAFGRASDSGSVVVDVLEGAYDPDGPVGELRVDSVVGEPEATIDGGEVRINRGPSPKVVPFRVLDSGGSAATGSVYVPATGVGFPYVDPDALITLDPGGDVKGSLTDHVVVPDGADLRLTDRSPSASPRGSLSARTTGDDSYVLSASPDYRGPGAMLVEVTTATDPSGNEDVADVTDGFTAMLSIPVQVGDDRPELTCPATVLPISAGQDLEVDLASVCKVWTVDPRDAAGLSYTAEWGTELSGVSLSGVEGSVVRVAASESASEGGTAILRVRAGSSNVEELTVQLGQAPPPRMLPVPVRDLKAGESRTIDLAPYLEAGVADPSPTIVSTTSGGSAGVRVSHSGSRITLSAGPQASGRASIDVVMSDVSSDSPPPTRRARGRITFSVGGLPGEPGAPVKVVLDRQNAVALDWTPPRTDGGSPITHYLLAPVGGGRTQLCRTTYCIYEGIKDNVKYRFRVRAVNKVGPGPWSANSLELKNDTRPGRVEDIRLVSRGDGVIELGWGKPVSSSEILDYTIVWQGSPAITVAGDALSYTAGPLDNNKPYTFTIKARNKIGFGPARTSGPMQSLGTPAPPGSLSVTDLQTGDDQTRFRASWLATRPEGSGVTTYTLLYDVDGSPDKPVPGCSRITETSCTHTGIPYNGATYTYAVTAHNEGGNHSAPSQTVSRQAVGRPAAWGDWQVTPTGRDNELLVQGTVPDPRGRAGTVDVIVAGAIMDSFSATAGQGFQRTVRTASNNEQVAVQLRLCNENAAQAGCSTTDPAKLAQSYGRLTGALNDIPQGTSTTGSKDVTWSFSGTGNGRPAVAVATVYSRRGVVREQAFDVGPGIWSASITATASEYDETLTLTVRLSDPVVSRGSTERSAQGTSGGPPPATLVIGESRPCGDGEGTTQPCKSEQWQTPCLVNSCGFLFIETANFIDNFTCRVDSGPPGYFANASKYFTANGRHEPGWYFPGGVPVTVTCSTSRQSATATFTFPPDP